MKFRLLKLFSAAGILFLFASATLAQSGNGIPSSSKFAPSSEPSPAPPAVEAPKKEEPKLTDRERALLERVDQLETRLAEVEGLVKRSTAETATTEPTKTPAQTDLAPTAPPDVRADEKGTQAGLQKKKKSEPFAFADWSWLTGIQATHTRPMTAQSRLTTCRAST